MCLYPKMIVNPKYKPNKKNGGIVPEPTDPRALYVPIGCGKCIECRRQEQRQWRVRLTEELKEQRRLGKNSYFVTLTFSPKAIELLEVGDNGDILDANAVAQKAVRRFLERYRKETGVSVRHWLITELGHKGTERIHLHGIIWTEKNIRQVLKHWKYGINYIGKYVNEKTINYISKYMLKMDAQHKNFKPQVFASAGIGRSYTRSNNFARARFNKEKTFDEYILPNGAKIALPIYYRNKRYTEEQREQLWLYKLDKGDRYILGVKVRGRDLEQAYLEQLAAAREINKRLGYGDNSKDWQKKDYLSTQRFIKKMTKHAEEVKKIERERGYNFTLPDENEINNYKREQSEIFGLEPITPNSY